MPRSVNIARRRDGVGRERASERAAPRRRRRRRRRAAASARRRRARDRRRASPAPMPMSWISVSPRGERVALARAGSRASISGAVGGGDCSLDERHGVVDEDAGRLARGVAHDAAAGGSWRGARDAGRASSPRVGPAGVAVDALEPDRVSATRVERRVRWGTAVGEAVLVPAAAEDPLAAAPACGARRAHASRRSRRRLQPRRSTSAARSRARPGARARR